MSRLNILEFPDPKLRTIAKPVEQFDTPLQQLADDMVETMYAAQGVGLAATQVDRHIRLLVMDVSAEQDQPQILINPEITEREGEQFSEEGCLSVPGINAKVKRAERVKVRAQNTSGDYFETELKDLGAICVQHEMDHLQGKLFVDYLSPLKRSMVRRKLEKQKRQEPVNAG